MARLAPVPRLLLTVLLLATALAAAPSASADGLPRTFTVPALQQGDAWTYAVADEGNGPRLLQRAYEQLGPSAAFTPDGLSVPTARLRNVETWQEGDAQVVHDWTYDVAADGSTVAGTHVRKDIGSQADGTITMPAGLDDIVQSDAEYPILATTKAGVEPGCGHRSDLQGARVRLADGIDLRGCPGNGHFVAVAMRVVAGQEALVLGLAEAPESYQVWFTADRPVPIRIVDRRSEDVRVEELVAFTAGQEPVAYGPAAPNLPALQLSARTAHVLDEAGLDHPFPLATAYAAAMADSDFAAVLGRTGSYLQAAHYRDLLVNQQSHQERERTWRLVATDGSAAAAVEVTQSTMETPQQSPTALATPALEPTVASVSEGNGPWPALAVVPAQAPTVASLVARWQAASSQAGAANAWGFNIRCANEACDAATLEAWAGRDLTTQPNDIEVTYASATDLHRDADLLAGDAMGRTAWTEQVSFGRESSLEGIPLLGSPPSTDQPVPTGNVPADASAAVPWTPIAVAGAIGLAALLLWLVKAGPLAGLFSRHIADVTANPVRRAVLEAIQAEPGIHHSELLRRVGKGNSVVTNHLGRLAAAGLVVERQGPRFRCYFPAGANKASLAAGPLVKSPVAQGILSAVAVAAASGQDLAQRLGVEPGAVTYHVQRLAQAGLLTTRRAGRFVLVEATEAGRQAAMRAGAAA